MDKIYINNLEFIGYHGVFPRGEKTWAEISSFS